MFQYFVLVGQQVLYAIPLCTVFCTAWHVVKCVSILKIKRHMIHNEWFVCLCAFRRWNNSIGIFIKLNEPIRKHRWTMMNWLGLTQDLNWRVLIRKLLDPFRNHSEDQFHRTPLMQIQSHLTSLRCRMYYFWPKNRAPNTTTTHRCSSISDWIGYTAWCVPCIGTSACVSLIEKCVEGPYVATWMRRMWRREIARAVRSINDGICTELVCDMWRAPLVWVAGQCVRNARMWCGCQNDVFFLCTWNDSYIVNWSTIYGLDVTVLHFDQTTPNNILSLFHSILVIFAFRWKKNKQNKQFISTSTHIPQVYQCEHCASPRFKAHKTKQKNIHFCWIGIGIQFDLWTIHLWQDNQMAFTWSRRSRWMNLNK